MFNFHGGTSISTASLSSVGFVGAFILGHSGNVIIAVLFLALSALSIFFLLATLTRFFINIQRHKKEFPLYERLSDPYTLK